MFVSLFAVSMGEGSVFWNLPPVRWALAVLLTGVSHVLPFTVLSPCARARSFRAAGRAGGKEKLRGVPRSLF